MKAKWNNDKWTCWQIRLTEEEENSLDSPVSDEKITTALWPLKPQDPMGYMSASFRDSSSRWETQSRKRLSKLSFKGKYLNA